MSLYRKYLFALPLTVLLLFIASTFAEAQRDTTGTAAKTDSIVKYLTPLEYAFMMHEETRFMLRVPVLGVGAEVELLPYFTLMGQAYIPSPDINTTSYYTLDGEMRYYYGSREKGVRNMSGNYFALGYKYQTFYLSGIYEPTNSYYGRWGIQRRLIGKGLIDLGINAGYRTSKITYRDLNNSGPFLQSTGIIGLGLVFNKEKALDSERLCPVLKCYQKETFLLKLNAINLFSLYHSTTLVLNNFEINPQIALEKKLFDFPFSIGVDFALKYSWQKHEYYAGQSEGTIIERNFGTLTGRAYGRYYYDLKNRIRKGRSGDGLSANYISAGVISQYQLGANRSEYSVPFYGFMLTTGVQRTFGNHFYFDVELGGGIDLDHAWPDPEWFLYGSTQLGIKF